MSILIDQNTRLLVQGITGRQAYMNTFYMSEYGTKVVAGVTPGKGGIRLDNGIPVFNSVEEALRFDSSINASVLYVPARAVKEAAFEAMDNGIKFLLITTERTPHQDILQIIQKAHSTNSRVVGPNSIGVISPGKAVIGLIGARVELAQRIFKQGSVGVVSRSGGQTTTLSFYLTMAGYGQSTALGIGGDAIVGTTWKDALQEFQKDSQTKIVVAFGEMGGAIEEEAADFIKHKGFSKPFIAYIAGEYALGGLRYGHAGAIISRGVGKVSDKKKTLKAAGAIILERLDDVTGELKHILGNSS